MKKVKIIIACIVLALVAVVAVLLVAGKNAMQKSQLTIVVENNTDVDFGAFAIIYPETGKQYGLDKVVAKDKYEATIDWDFEKDKELNWAIYNMGGELYMESKTLLKDGANKVVLTFEGTGQISSVETVLSIENTVK